jgi:subtilisin family serine protease
MITESLPFPPVKLRPNLLWVFVLLFASSTLHAQSRAEAWMTVVARSADLKTDFQQQDGSWSYVGGDQQLSGLLDKHHVQTFKPVYAAEVPDEQDRTFFIKASDPALLDDLLERTNLFESGRLWTAEDKRIHQPNDYGLTSTVGENRGLNVILDYLDFLGLPKAWYYTTGSPDIMVGIADAEVDTTDIEFAGKVKVFQASTFSKGHGSGVAAIIAAKGDNQYGIPGLCYDCNIAATRYGFFKDYKQLRELSDAGVRVINCSFVSSSKLQTAQAAIDTMYSQGTIIVAGAGNQPWSKTKGEKRYYPASYDKVISVSAVMYKYPDPLDNLLYAENSNNPYVANARGFLGRTAGFKDHNPRAPMRIYPVSTATLNPEVDLLAPTVGVFRYPAFMLEDKIEYIGSAATSVAAPFVTGTIGLMLSLYPCLAVEQIEPILKLTATPIDHLAVNAPYKGNYGAGIVHAGRAVELVYQLNNPDETALISGQRFSRWEFPLTAYSKEVRIEEQEFTAQAVFDLKASNSVVLGAGTVLRPGRNGSVHISIDPDMEQQCELRLRSD